MFEYPAATADAAAIVTFWKEAGPELWFAKRPDFDRRFRERFGRFPYRNPILGRVMLPAEQRFLDEGGFAG
jgi:uncharacterized protein (DUF924 family)